MVRAVDKDNWVLALVPAPNVDAPECSPSPTPTDESGEEVSAPAAHTLRKRLKLRTRLFSQRAHSPSPSPLGIVAEVCSCCLEEAAGRALDALAETACGLRESTEYRFTAAGWIAAGAVG